MAVGPGTVFLRIRAESAYLRKAQNSFLSTESYCALQINPEELYQREGGVPAQRLQEALQSQAQSTDAHTLALQASLSGIVWTASMRRMYTLVDRYALLQQLGTSGLPHVI